MSQELSCKVGYIYQLLDPLTKEIRYIGQTKDPERRLKQHLRSSYKCYKTNWIKSLKTNDQTPKMLVFRCVSLDSIGREEEQWIEYYKNLGAPLTNHMSGYSTKPSTQTKYSNYIGVSYNKKEERFIAFIELDGFKYISTFKEELEAKLWHDRVASYYGLPVNEDPDFKRSLDKAKLLIKKERTELGLIGVTKVKNSFVATIMLDRKDNYLGCFKTSEEAAYYADATRNFYGLTNNQTTQDKLSVEEARLRIAQTKPPKGIRKTGTNYSVRVNVDKVEYNFGGIPTKEEAVYISDALRNFYGLNNSGSTRDRLSLDEVLVRYPRKLSSKEK